LLLEKQSKKQTNKHYYLIITLNHYSFYFSFKNETKAKNKLKDIQSKIQENIINASVTGQ
jgi:spore coat protein CotF